MEDSELQKIRAARLAQLQSGSGTSERSGGGEDGGVGGEDQRHAILSQLLDASARDRLRRIALVKKERAEQVEQLLLRMAKSGQIRQRVTEPELVALLTQINDNASAGSRSSNVSITRLRRGGDDSDED